MGVKRWYFVMPKTKRGGVWIRSEDRSQIWGIAASIPITWRVPRHGNRFLKDIIQ